MENWEARLMAQLDVDQPDWFIEWASQRDLIDEIKHRGAKDQKTFLSERVANKLFHRILNAAIAAGIVQES